jgi:outer membrane lipoprotein SlyB
MVLIAATALTVFSILGSAMITGLIPSARSERVDDGAKLELNDTNTIEKTKAGEQDIQADKNTASGKISLGNKTDSAKSGNVVSNSTNQVVSCQDCGRIISIKHITTDGEATGLGAVAGGVTGGVIGNQIGKGQGNVLMTILGVGGGAYAGHTIEKKVNAETAYVIKVKMENGEYKTVRQHHEPTFAIGDAVKVKNGSLTSA